LLNEIVVCPIVRQTGTPDDIKDLHSTCLLVMETWSHGHNEQVQNYQPYGLCLSSDILSQSTLFGKLDLLLSSGKWHLLSSIHLEDLIPNIRPDADHDILFWFRISDIGQSAGR
jgi:hypothetical protein